MLAATLVLQGRCAMHPADIRLPHLFEIVEFANLGPEDVDDDIARVDQDPVAGVSPSTRMRASPRAFSLSRSCSAMAPTCRSLRPEATTMKSPSADFPSRGMETISSALASSSQRTTSRGERPNPAPWRRTGRERHPCGRPRLWFGSSGKHPLLVGPACQTARPIPDCRHSNRRRDRPQTKSGQRLS